MLSTEEVEDFVAAHAKFIEAAEETERRYREITGEGFYGTTIYLEDDEVVFEGEEHRGYGEWTRHRDSLPLRALHDEAFWEELEAEKRERDRKERQAKQRRRRDAARRQKEKELRELAKLRAKYPEEAAAGA